MPLVWLERVAIPVLLSPPPFTVTSALSVCVSAEVREVRHANPLSASYYWNKNVDATSMVRSERILVKKTLWESNASQFRLVRAISNIHLLS